jgi:hypothetical protein
MRKKVLTMPRITPLGKTMHGIKSAFLMEEGDILDIDTQSDTEVIFPSMTIQFLLETIREKKRSVKSISISADDRLFIFVHDKYVLGITTMPDVNVPMLNLMARQILTHVETQEELPESVKGAGKSLPENQIIVSRLSPGEISELPDAIRSLLSLVDGHRTLKEIVRLSDLPTEQVVEFIHNYRRTGKLVGIEKGFDRKSVCERLHSQRL